MVIISVSNDVSDQRARESDVDNSSSREDVLNESPDLPNIDERNNVESTTSAAYPDRNMEATPTQKQLQRSPNKTAQDDRDGKEDDNPETPTNNESMFSPCSIKVSVSKPNRTPYLDHCLESHRKKRSTLGAPDTTHCQRTVSSNEQKIDDYVRSGAHFRSLLNYAFSKISNGVTQAQSECNEMSMCAVHHHDVKSDGENSLKRNITEDGISLPQDDVRPLRRRRLNLMIDNSNDNDEQYDAYRINSERSGKKYASELAKEKMAEILKLKRSLKEAEEHAAAMTQVNFTLREASATTSAKMGRTTEALRIAGQNAANARADADAAEARAASLVSQINSMTSILDETKRTCDFIRNEHDEISAASRSLEGRLMQTESDLNRLDREKRQGDEDRNALRVEVERICMAKKRLQINLDEKDDEASKLKKNLAERDDVEQARVERTNRVESELRDARSMLVDATSAATEAESTIGVLQESIKELQRENKTHHDRISEIIETSGIDKARLQNSLSDSERGAQKFRMKIASNEEELERQKLNSTTQEKEITQLKNRLSSLEKRLAETSSSDPSGIASSSPTSKPDLTSPVMKFTKKSKDIFVIPPLRSTSPKTRNISIVTDGKENMPRTNRLPSITRRQTIGSAPLKSVKCCICFRPAHGIMKSCQCGRPVCDKRAHALCITGKNPLPSVSYPGMPAPLLPCVLCKTGLE